MALVLHAHLPWVRHPEHARSLEERWLFEAMWESYLPLVAMLERLANEGVRAPFTLSVSPTLAAMWGDPLLRQRFRDHLRRTRAVLLRAREKASGSSLFLPALAHHEGLLERAEEGFERCGGDLLSAFVKHHREGRIGLLTTAATHAFLPGLLPVPPWAGAQIGIGQAAFESMSGVRPSGLWLPECAFEGPIDAELARAGVAFTVLDAHGIALAEPRPDVVTLGSGSSAVVVPTAPVRSAAGVTYFGRDLWAGRAVWAMDGYPSDPAYREFHRDLGFAAEEADLLGEVGPNGTRVATGIKLHRITGPRGDKAPYEPGSARAKALSHAADFVADRARLFAALPGSALPPVSVVPFDAELFGHFWHEGPVFLEGVLRRLAANEEHGGPLAITLDDYVARYPALFRAAPATSTWGEGGHGATWMGPDTAGLWRHVHHTVKAVSAVTRRIARSERARCAPLSLAIIQALLLQSSDFAFMMHRRTTASYAEQRTAEHAANALRLAALAVAGNIGVDDEAWMRALAERTPFLRGVDVEALVGLVDEGARGFTSGAG